MRVIGRSGYATGCPADARAANPCGILPSNGLHRRPSAPTTATVPPRRTT